MTKDQFSQLKPGDRIKVFSIRAEVVQGLSGGGPDRFVTATYLTVFGASEETCVFDCHADLVEMDTEGVAK